MIHVSTRACAVIMSKKVLLAVFVHSMLAFNAGEGGIQIRIHRHGLGRSHVVPWSANSADGRGNTRPEVYCSKVLDSYWSAELHRRAHVCDANILHTDQH